MKYNSSIEAIVELAGFDVWDDYQVNFLERCGEFLSSILSSVKIAEKTNILLQQSQVQAEQLRVQEEELRQNMEELAATNEEMKRKEEEALRIIMNGGSTKEETSEY